jgi:hypothetical protein
MGTSRSLAGLLVIAASVFVSVGGVGCAGRVTYYDEEHHDYHRWNNNEVVIYRSYWTNRHEPYREYSTLNKDEQREYWRWRHDHH